jgi:replication initiation and membrane attachment protein DnaB
MKTAKKEKNNPNVTIDFNRLVDDTGKLSDIQKANEKKLKANKETLKTHAIDNNFLSIDGSEYLLNFVGSTNITYDIQDVFNKITDIDKIFAEMQTNFEVDLSMFKKLLDMNISAFLNLVNSNNTNIKKYIDLTGIEFLKTETEDDHSRMVFKKK